MLRLIEQTEDILQQHLIEISRLRSSEKQGLRIRRTLRRRQEEVWKQGNLQLILKINSLSRTKSKRKLWTLATLWTRIPNTSKTKKADSKTQFRLELETIELLCSCLILRRSLRLSKRSATRALSESLILSSQEIMLLHRRTLLSSKLWKDKELLIARSLCKAKNSIVQLFPIQTRMSLTQLSFPPTNKETKAKTKTSEESQL